MRQSTQQYMISVLPGLYLQAQLLKWRCSAEPGASWSVPHSPGDPFYCLLTAREEIHHKITSAERQMQTNYALIFLGLAWELEMCLISEKRVIIGDRPLSAFLSSQQSGPQGPERSDLNWWQWEWVGQETRMRSCWSSSHMTETRPNQSALCGATRRKPQL